jgi:DNA-binding transcriptional MerR regulator/methylmalonyl-CoA mutase cobalamin-binding subunit
VEATYNIRSVIELTGLNEHTLRAWERRHDLVQPRRTPTGRRLYTAADIERLRLAMRLNERGHAVSQLATLSNDELTDLLAEMPVLGAPRAEPPTELVTSKIRANVESALRRYQLAAVYEQLHAARLTLGTQTFVLDVVAPIMTTVGAMIASGHMSIAQEHALSAISKGHLLALLVDLRHAHGASGARRVGFATMSGDLHEIGLLVSAVLCAKQGMVVEYLGPNLPCEALAEALTAMRTDIVTLAVTPLPPGQRVVNVVDYLKTLAAGLPRRHEIWLGGTMPRGFDAGAIGRPCRHFATLKAFATHIGGAT